MYYNNDNLDNNDSFIDNRNSSSFQMSDQDFKFVPFMHCPMMCNPQFCGMCKPQMMPGHPGMTMPHMMPGHPGMCKSFMMPMPSTRDFDYDFDLDYDDDDLSRSSRKRRRRRRRRDDFFNPFFLYWWMFR